LIFNFFVVFFIRDLYDFFELVFLYTVVLVFLLLVLLFIDL
jgi:hypothetical protein